MSDIRQLEIALVVVKDLQDYLGSASGEPVREYIERAQRLLEVTRLEIQGAIRVANQPKTQLTS